MQKKIKELPESQRPYEKCQRDGSASLSDSELLAVILKSGTQGSNSIDLASEVLQVMEHSPYPGLSGILHISMKELMMIKGIGPVKAVQLKCIGELSKRIAMSVARPQLCLNHPDTIAHYYMERLRHEEQELMICMMLDSGMHLLGDPVLSIGTVNSALITPREIYKEALRYHAVSVILIHNHPSGNPYPSQEDILITEKISKAGELIGIRLVDHIIIGDQRYISFMEQGFMEQYQD